LARLSLGCACFINFQGIQVEHGQIGCNETAAKQDAGDLFALAGIQGAHHFIGYFETGNGIRRAQQCVAPQVENKADDEQSGARQFD
jgi:hypothetical protein